MIRWSSSVLTAIILHAVCWFWADQILPPDISESQRSQRLAITIATNQITSSKLAPVNQENLAPPSILPVLPSPQIMKREHVTQPESNESPEPQKKQITAKPVIAKITKSTLKQIQIRPKRKALPPVRNKVETPLPKVKTKTPSIAVLDSQPGQKTLPSPVQAVKTSPSSSPKEVL
ncbi:hypothetical protein, partial [Kiloniella sp.]|uniref:hypothetical protein n=1 Tax=Kiloniella sp. TaxID=1938587 RepID=UPI003B029C3C